LPTIHPSASPLGTPHGTDDSTAVAWERLLSRFADLFTRPSTGLFCTLVTGWALCPGRRTVTRMISLADPQGRRAHDAYHLATYEVAPVHLSDVRNTRRRYEERSDLDCCILALLERAAGATPRSEALQDKVSLPARGRPTREGRSRLLAPRRLGAGLRWYGQHMLIVDKHRDASKAEGAVPREAEGLSLQRLVVRSAGMVVPSPQPTRPPVDRRGLTHRFGAGAERGKPVVHPSWGKQSVRSAHGPAGIGSRRKRKTSCNGAHRG